MMLICSSLTEALSGVFQSASTQKLCLLTDICACLSERLGQEFTVTISNACRHKCQERLHVKHLDNGAEYACHSQTVSKLLMP